MIMLNKKYDCDNMEDYSSEKFKILEPKLRNLFKELVS